MERFNALNIDSPKRTALTAIFTYSDNFIDQGLRRYTFKQAMHLYLRRHGYEIIVYYNTSSGFCSFEKEMLETFLSPVQAPDSGSGDIVVQPEQRGRLRGSVLGKRTRRNMPGRRDVPDNGVPVSHPEHNLYFNADSQMWCVKTVGNRVANMDEMIYNMSKRRHMAILADVSDTSAEFDMSIMDTLVTTINQTMELSHLDNTDINDNRFILLVNAQACRSKVMELFQGAPLPPQHPSSLLRSFYQYFIHKPEKLEHYILDFNHSFPLPQPTTQDVINTLLKARNDSGITKNVDWTALNDICEQFALMDGMTFNQLYHLMSEKEEYTYDAFKSDNIKKRGDSISSLDELIGLAEVKEKIAEFRNRMEMAIERGEDISSLNKHLVFYGNPGTGKTVVARIMAGIFRDLGLVRKGHLVEVSREHLVAGYVGQSAIKTSNVLDSAMDGVLFIDEAYRLADGGENDFGKEAVDTILARMENDRDRLVVIFAGYEKDMERLYKLNDGIPSRINTYLNFHDYNEEELKHIFLMMARKKYTVPPEVERVLEAAIKYAMGYKSRTNDTDYKFGNARWVRNLLEKVEYRVAARRKTSDISVLQSSDFEISDMKELIGFSPDKETQTETEPSNMEKLQAMIGLEGVKKEMRTLVGSVESERRHREAGLKPKKSQGPSRHMVFSGNPGTGKTTVARLLGGIYYDLGLLSRGHVVEIENRGFLIQGYEGQTAKRVNEVFDSAKGGVLFIDEIYSLILNSQDTFGHEALSTLITRIENERDDIVVVFAGYASKMKGFFSNNPGLQSRFNKYIHFDDYNAGELMQIVMGFLAENDLQPDDAALTALEEYINSCCPLAPQAGNGRWARNLADWIVSAHQDREISENLSTREELTLCTLNDVQEGVRRFGDNQLRGSHFSNDFSK